MSAGAPPAAVRHADAALRLIMTLTAPLILIRIRCSSKLIVMVYIADVSNGNFQLDVVIPTNRILIDPATGDSFQAVQPIAVNVKWVDARVEYVMMPDGQSFQSAYELVSTSTSVGQCPAATLCCPASPATRLKSFKQDPVVYAWRSALSTCTLVAHVSGS